MRVEQKHETVQAARKSPTPALRNRESPAAEARVWVSRQLLGEPAPVSWVGYPYATGAFFCLLFC